VGAVTRERRVPASVALRSGVFRTANGRPVSGVDGAYEGGVSLAEAAIGRMPATSNVAAAAARDLVIAEGDSWFDYPLQDVLEELEALGFEIELVAQRADSLENMAYAGRQLDRLARCFRRVGGRQGPGRTPRVILLSGGVGDITSDAFAMPGEAAHAGGRGLDQQVLGERLHDALGSLIGTVQRFSLEFFGCEVPVVVHGYAAPVTDEGGWLRGGWILPGSWLDPCLGHSGAMAGTGALAARIEAFNEMLGELAASLTVVGKDVRYVDLRSVLLNRPQDGDDCPYDLHPTRRAIKAIAGEFARHI
jgi:hypothetical protein